MNKPETPGNSSLVVQGFRRFARGACDRLHWGFFWLRHGRLRYALSSFRDGWPF